MRSKDRVRTEIAPSPLLFCLPALALTLWGACSQGRAPQEPSPAPQESRVSPDLEPFLTSYFSSWSEGDINGYRDHFHDEAVIVFVDGGEIRSRMPLEPFIEEQAAMQSDPETRAAERMTGFRADEDRRAATVAVDWLLERGERQQRGVDRFTLIRDAEGNWKIVTLVFYVTDRGGGGGP